MKTKKKKSEKEAVEVSSFPGGRCAQDHALIIIPDDRAGTISVCLQCALSFYRDSIKLAEVLKQNEGKPWRKS